MIKILAFCAFFATAAHALSTQPYLDFKEPTAFSATTTSALALAENTRRRYLIIQNNGTDSVLVKFSSVHTANEGLEIIATGNYELLTPPYNSVYIKAVTGTQDVVIYEAN